MTSDSGTAAAVPFAVTGATGGVGSRVAHALAAAGATQRLIVRDADRAPNLPGASVAVAEYRDGEAMRAALTGADALLLVSGRESKDRLEEHRSAVAAARDAGVRRVVYTSFLGAAPDATFTLGRQHWATEQALLETGMTCTFLRDSLYADFVPYMASADDRTIRGPAADGRVAPVAREDVAAVATAVLLGDGAHDGQTYELTGPALLTMAECAALLGDLTGQPVHYVAETVEEAYRSRERYGAPDWEVEGWVTSYTSIASGEMSRVSDAVERVSGRPALSLRDLMVANPELWAHLA